MRRRSVLNGVLIERYYVGHECMIERALERVKGGPMVDMDAHVNDAYALVDDCCDVRDMGVHQTNNLAQLGGMMVEHRDKMKQAMNAVKGRMELVRENEGGNGDDRDDADVSKMLLKADLLVAQSSLKHLDAMKLLMASAVDHQKALMVETEYLYKDMRGLLDRLEGSQRQADNFSLDMEGFGRKKWMRLQGAGQVREGFRHDDQREEGDRRAALRVEAKLKAVKRAQHNRRHK